MYAEVKRDTESVDNANSPTEITSLPSPSVDKLASSVRSERLVTGEDVVASPVSPDLEKLGKV